MNMLDMQTREKVNRLHIAEMQRAARARHQLRGLPSSRIPTITEARTRLLFIGVILVLLAAAFLMVGKVS
jgi:hypothetical protein